MKTDPCKDLYTIQHYSIRYYDDPEKNRRRTERVLELIGVVDHLAIEEIEIHHYGRDYLNKCPAIKDRKAWPTTEVYGRAGCVECFYHAGFGLRHVRCKLRAAREKSYNM